MADDKTVIEETTEEKPEGEATETTTEDKKEEGSEDKSDKKKEKEDKKEEKEEKIDPIAEKKKNNQDRAWERMIEKNTRLVARVEQLEHNIAQQQVQKQQQDAPTAPKREDFTEIGDYLEAKQDYNNLVLQQRLEQRLAQIQPVQDIQPETDWDQAEEKARAKYADYDEIVEDAQNVMVPEVAIEAIRRSPIGPDLTYHLAKNPADAQKLSRMKVAGDQIFYLGQLAGRLTEAKNPAPKASAAPKPITPVRSNGGTVETDRDKLSDEEWFAIRQKEKMKRMGFKT